MKTNTKTIVALSIVALIAIIGGIIYSKAVKALPPDGVDARLMRFDGINGKRYTEIFLIGGNGITKHLVGGVYNTLGLNDSGNGDTCPQAVLDKVDVKALAKELTCSWPTRTARVSGPWTGWRSKPPRNAISMG